MIKKYINNFFSLFGYTIQKKHNRKKFIDDLYPILIKKEHPIIFDVGASKGQSIERYQRLYKNSIIHSFEPVKNEYNLLKEKFKNNPNIYLSNVGVGDQLGEGLINITKNTGHSSFLNINKNTRWINERSKSAGVKGDEYISKQENVSIITLDEYCKKNNIGNIDIIKIDTQGYEDKVLKGCSELIKNDKINLIQVELIFADIYEKSLNFYDIERYLIPNNFRLFAINNFVINKPFKSHLRNAQYADIYYLKLPRSLKYADRSSMHNSIETRVPFLDHKIVEWSLQIPSKFKLLNEQQRIIMKYPFKDYVNKEVLFLNKRTIADPQSKWMKKNLKSMFFDLINSKNFNVHGFLNKNEVIKYFKNLKAIEMFRILLKIFKIFNNFIFVQKTVNIKVFRVY